MTDELFDTADELSALISEIQMDCIILKQQLSTEEEASCLSERQILWMKRFIKDHGLWDEYLGWIRPDRKE